MRTRVSTRFKLPGRVPISLSPPSWVPPETPICECIRKMKHERLNYLLVMNKTEQLVGIFTEHDFLGTGTRFCDDSSSIDRPVATVMSSPVSTLLKEQIAGAPAVLFGSGFHHLPIIERTPSGTEKVLGVATLNDLFDAAMEAWRERKKAGAPPAKPISRRKYRIGVLCADLSMRSRVRRRVECIPGATVRLIPLELLRDEMKLSDAIRALDAIIVDIDGLPARDWLELMKDCAKAPGLHAVVFFDPITHPASTRALMNRLIQSPRFQVYPKPIDLEAVIGLTRVALDLEKEKT